MLDKHGVSPRRIVDARKEPLADEAAWALLAGVREILVAKGKGFAVLAPQPDTRESVLAAALGRTGNLRAPALLIGDRLLVGFSEGLYSHFFGSSS